jgi:hypothetical protein
MSSIYLVVEDSDEAQMLRRLLPAQVRKKIEFVFREEGSSSISTARTLLALGGRPVALVVDAGTTDQSQIAAQRETLTGLLGNASPSLPYRVFIATPSLSEVLAHRNPINQLPLIQEIKEFVQKVTACEQALGTPAH